MMRKKGTQSLYQEQAPLFRNLYLLRCVLEQQCGYLPPVGFRRTARFSVVCSKGCRQTSVPHHWLSCKLNFLQCRVQWSQLEVAVCALGSPGPSSLRPPLQVSSACTTQTPNTFPLLGGHYVCKFISWQIKDFTAAYKLRQEIFFSRAYFKVMAFD